MKAVIPAIFQCSAPKENNSKVLGSLGLFISVICTALQNFKQPPSVALEICEKRLKSICASWANSTSGMYCMRVENNLNREGKKKISYLKWLFLCCFWPPVSLFFLLIKDLFLSPTVCFKPWWLWQLSTFSYKVFIFTPTVSAILAFSQETLTLSNL